MNVLFQPSDVITLDEERTAIVLGLLTFTLALAILLSCRSWVSLLNRLGFQSPLNNRVYRSFYNYHTYYWWGFGFVITLHLLTGIMHVGVINTIRDPDAYLHWYSIWTGLAGFVALSIVILTSCRSFAHTLAFLMQKSPLTNKIYRSFYRYHSYYWFPFVAIIIAHFTIGYIHAGIWPTA